MLMEVRNLTARPHGEGLRAHWEWLEAHRPTRICEGHWLSAGRRDDWRRPPAQGPALRAPAPSRQAGARPCHARDQLYQHFRCTSEWEQSKGVRTGV